MFHSRATVKSAKGVSVAQSLLTDLADTGAPDTTRLVLPRETQVALLVYSGSELVPGRPGPDWTFVLTGT